LLAHGRWFSPGTPASSITKADRHDIAEILLIVALSTINQINLVLISHFHHIVAENIYIHHKNLVAGQHVEIFGRFRYVFYPRHGGSLSEFSPKTIKYQLG
jgi:hypothetical protein